MGYDPKDDESDKDRKAREAREELLPTIYDNQILTKYEKKSETNDGSTNDTTSFVFYNGYTINEENSSKVGLDEETGNMYDQSFAVTAIKTFTNQSSAGSTMVKVFKTKITDDGITLIRDGEIDLTEERNKAVWSGEEPFTTEDIKRYDTNYFYMVYYWRLNDGRYLEDTKLVKLSAASYNVEMVTGLLGEKHLDTQTEKGVDQYIDGNVDAISGETGITYKWEENQSIS